MTEDSVEKLWLGQAGRPEKESSTLFFTLFGLHSCARCDFKLTLASTTFSSSPSSLLS
jgi:hypothetical protein